jgi:pimeloyl-ACP methyl ester carboxylesterase
MLFGMATGGSVIAGAIPMRPLKITALTLCRGWRNLRRSAWWGFEEVARHDWTRIIEAGRAIGRFDSRSWVADISVPTAVIATHGDDVVPHRRQLALAAAIPGATLHLLNGGHTTCTMTPERFVPTLVAACRGVARRAATGVRTVVGDAA